MDKEKIPTLGIDKYVQMDAPKNHSKTTYCTIPILDGCWAIIYVVPDLGF